MNKADLIVSEIMNSLSPELHAMLNTTFGDVPELASPADKESAILAIGQANVNFNNAVLVPLSGLPIVELILKNAVLNEVLKGLLLSSVEVADPPSNGKISMIMPSDGGIYYGGINNIKCQATDAISIEAKTATGSESLQQDPEHPDIWKADYGLYDEGIHTMKVSGEFADETDDSLSVTFQIQFWETAPKEGETLEAGTRTFGLFSEDDLTSVTISGTPAVYDAALGAWSAALEVAAGIFEAAYTVIKDGVEHNKVVNIFVSGE